MKNNKLKIGNYTIQYYYEISERQDKWHVSHATMGYCGCFDTLEDAKEYCING